MVGGTVTDTRPGEGLRERHRRLTAAEIEEAALRMFAERGFDAVPVDDIAIAAGISRRTFFRYFSSKEDVLFHENTQRQVELAEALSARPAGEPVLTALRHAILSMVSDFEQERERLLRRLRIIYGSPALQAGALGRQQSWEQAVSELVAQRLGVDPVVDLRPGVVASTTLAAVRVAIGMWLAGEGRANLPALVAEALDLLDGGLQQLEGQRRVPGAGRGETRPQPASHEENAEIVLG
jgi:AcrR family transcriptional regulator